VILLHPSYLNATAGLAFMYADYVTLPAQPAGSCSPSNVVLDDPTSLIGPREASLLEMDTSTPYDGLALLPLGA